jgi:hypothetical protein
VRILRVVLTILEETAALLAVVAALSVALLWLEIWPYANF